MSGFLYVFSKKEVNEKNLSHKNDGIKPKTKEKKRKIYAHNQHKQIYMHVHTHIIRMEEVSE